MPVRTVATSTLRLALVATVLALLSAAWTAPAALAAPREASHIVQFRAGTRLASERAIVRAAGGHLRARLPIIDGVAADLPARALPALRHDPAVEAVSTNAGVTAQAAATIDPAADGPTAPADTATATSASTADTAVTGPAAPADSATAAPAGGASALTTAYPGSVFAPAAWATTTGRGVGVAVIDTGIAGDLPDFGGADGASRVVASVVGNPGATTAADTYGHGTHVAGIIAGDGRRRAAADPLAGRYVGIAPEAQLISVKVDDDAGNATVLDVINGLQFVVDHRSELNIRVVNLSLESTTAESYRTSALDAAVEAAWFNGIVVVAAAGNRGATADAADFAPGNDPFAITVGAVDDQSTDTVDDDAYAGWSSVGTSQDGFRKPEIGAPGAHIVSTLAPGSAFTRLCASCVVDGQYIRAGGTSMAAPVVSGVVALMLQLHPDWTPDQVKATLLATRRQLPGGVEEVDAQAATSAQAPTAPGNAGIAPNDLVDRSTGAIDYTRSSWSRSSWSAAPDPISAGWARSSWSCACAPVAADGVDATRSSWSRSSWSTRWTF